MAIPIILASTNSHKIKEIRSSLPDAYTLSSMQEVGFQGECAEPFFTFEENAFSKALCVRTFFPDVPYILSEDSGLCVDALGGAPGVRSARYAQNSTLLSPSDADNIAKLLQELQGQTNRQAHFITVFCLLSLGEVLPLYFQGICKGKIAFDKEGSGTFGYDPIFIPDGAMVTFAAMSLEEKRKYAHREKALQQLLIYLKGKHQ